MGQRVRRILRDGGVEVLNGLLKSFLCSFGGVVAAQQHLRDVRLDRPAVHSSGGRSCCVGVRSTWLVIVRAMFIRQGQRIAQVASKLCVQMTSPVTPLMSLAVIRHPSPAADDRTFYDCVDLQFPRNGWHWLRRLFCSASPTSREITRSPPIVARSAMSCSVMPSAKYSCSGSPDTFSSGSTATDRIWSDGPGRPPLRSTRHDPDARIPRARRSGCAATHFHAWRAFGTSSFGGAWVRA